MYEIIGVAHHTLLVFRIRDGRTCLGNQVIYIFPFYWTVYERLLVYELLTVNYSSLRPISVYGIMEYRIFVKKKSPIFELIALGQKESSH